MTASTQSHGTPQKHVSSGARCESPYDSLCSTQAPKERDTPWERPTCSTHSTVRQHSLTRFHGEDQQNFHTTAKPRLPHQGALACPTALKHGRLTHGYRAFCLPIPERIMQPTMRTHSSPTRHTRHDASPTRNPIDAQHEPGHSKVVTTNGSHLLHQRLIWRPPFR